MTPEPAERAPLQPDPAGRVAPEQLALSDIFPDHGHRLVAGLIHDLALLDAVRRRAGREAGPERVPAELGRVQPDAGAGIFHNSIALAELGFAVDGRFVALDGVLQGAAYFDAEGSLKPGWRKAKSSRPLEQACRRHSQRKRR